MDYEILKKKVKLEVTNDEQAREFEKLHNVKVKKGRTNYVLYRSKNYSIEERSDIIVDTRIIMSKQDYDYFMSLFGGSKDGANWKLKRYIRDLIHNEAETFRNQEKLIKILKKKYENIEQLEEDKIEKKKNNNKKIEIKQEIIEEVDNDVFTNSNDMYEEDLLLDEEDYIDYVEDTIYV